MKIPPFPLCLRHTTYKNFHMVVHVILKSKFNPLEGGRGKRANIPRISKTSSKTRMANISRITEKSWTSMIANIEKFKELKG